MRVSLFTQSLFALPLNEALPAAVEAGYDSIELACVEPHFGLAVAQSSPHRVAERIAAEGLTVSALSLFTHFTEPNEMDRQIAMAETFIRLAPVFGTTVVKLTSGPPSSRDATPEHWASLSKAAKRLAVTARNEGVRLAFETHMRQLTDTMASSLKLLDSVEDNAGLTVDFSNLAFAGDDPAAAVEAFRGRIFNAHVKNGYIDGAGNWCFRGLDEGLTNYPAVLRTLKAIGYDGCLTVECLGPDAAERPIETARRDRIILERLLREQGDS